MSENQFCAWSGGVAENQFYAWSGGVAEKQFYACSGKRVSSEPGLRPSSMPGTSSVPGGSRADHLPSDLPKGGAGPTMPR